MTDPTVFPPRYLADGVYASHDGYQIWLRTDRDGMVHEIALDGDAFGALMIYADDLRRFLMLAAEHEKAQR